MENFEREIKKEPSPEASESRIEKGVPEKEPLPKNTELAEQAEIKKSESAPVQELKESGAPLVETDDERIKYYLEMAEEKGASAAIKAAAETNDSNLLDKVHDALVQNGLLKS